jgi:ferredoxin
MSAARIIWYFSGTGNTARAAALVVSTAAEAGGSGRLCSIEDANARAAAEGPGPFTLAFPVYAFSVPPIVRRFIRRLPPGRGRQCPVLAVCAGGALGAPEQARRMLRRRGWSVPWSGSVAYPENWTQMSAPPAGEEAAAQVREGDAQARRAAAEILGGAELRERPSPGLAVLGSVVGAAFVHLGRRILGKIYIADERCTSCGQCARTCPAHAIRMTAGPRGGAGAAPRWRLSCEDCCRCINTCPEAAIQTSPLRLAVHAGSNVVLLTAAVIAAVYGAAPLHAALPAVPHAVSLLVLLLAGAAAALVIQFGPVDWLLDFLQGLKALRPAFTRSWTRRFARYTAPGYAPPQKQ